LHKIEIASHRNHNPQYIAIVTQNHKKKNKDCRTMLLQQELARNLLSMASQTLLATISMVQSVFFSSPAPEFAETLSKQPDIIHTIVILLVMMIYFKAASVVFRSLSAFWDTALGIFKVAGFVGSGIVGLAHRCGIRGHRREQEVSPFDDATENSVVPPQPTNTATNTTANTTAALQGLPRLSTEEDNYQTFGQSFLPPPRGAVWYYYHPVSQNLVPWPQPPTTPSMPVSMPGATAATQPPPLPSLLLSHLANPNSFLNSQFPFNGVTQNTNEGDYPSQGRDRDREDDISESSSSDDGNDGEDEGEHNSFGEAKGILEHCSNTDDSNNARTADIEGLNDEANRLAGEAVRDAIALTHGATLVEGDSSKGSASVAHSNCSTPTDGKKRKSLSSSSVDDDTESHPSKKQRLQSAEEKFGTIDE
jgi:hypothetical protein